MDKNDQIIIFIANLVSPQSLTPIERKIIRYACEGKTYQQIANDYNCDVYFIKQTAHCFWERLSQEFGIKVTKTNFKSIIEGKLASSLPSKSSLKKEPEIVILPKRDSIPVSDTELIAQFWLNGRGLGKARPRKTSRHDKMHLPPKYKQWLIEAIRVIRIQMRDKSPAPKPARLQCFFGNFLSSDSSNLTGAVEDAFVQAGYLQNDSSSFVIESSGKFAIIKKRRGIPEDMGILVNVYKGKIEVLEPDIVDEFRLKYPEIFVSPRKRG